MNHAEVVGEGGAGCARRTGRGTSAGNTVGGAGCADTGGLVRVEAGLTLGHTVGALEEKWVVAARRKSGGHADAVAVVGGVASWTSSDVAGRIKVVGALGTDVSAVSEVGGILAEVAVGFDCAFLVDGVEGVSINTGVASAG